MRSSHGLLRKNLLNLKEGLQTLLLRARELNLSEGEEISVGVAHKIRQIDGMILTLEAVGSRENGIQFTDLFFLFRQLRHQYHQFSREIALFYEPPFFSETAVKRLDENLTRR